MATGLSLSPLEGNRWNGHGDRSDNVIRGMEFELSCAHRLFGEACKVISGNKNTDAVPTVRSSWDQEDQHSV